ncbi:cell wall-associated NlpC family hydrolase [Dysgonomonadaceae bacterium PH5-43]|nr:cell wall-associated NlpC family hydrolase [Dysgonomonadaceae bacterium PH5-43]
MKLRLLFYSLLVIILFASCSSSKYAQKKERYDYVYEQSKDVKKTKDNKDTKQLLSFARKYIGVKYKVAGTSPQGFDCSGYVQYVFKNFNYNLPRNSVEQSKVGKEIKKSDIKPGDLVFFKGSSSSKVGHVGIVVETYTDNTFKFIHVSMKSGVTEDYSTNNYWSTRYIRARRVT